MLIPYVIYVLLVFGVDAPWEDLFPRCFAELMYFIVQILK